MRSIKPWAGPSTRNPGEPGTDASGNFGLEQIDRLRGKLLQRAAGKAKAAVEIMRHVHLIPALRIRRPGGQVAAVPVGVPDRVNLRTGGRAQPSGEVGKDFRAAANKGDPASFHGQELDRAGGRPVRQAGLSS